MTLDHLIFSLSLLRFQIQFPLPFHPFSIFTCLYKIQLPAFLLDSVLSNMADNSKPSFDRNNNDGEEASPLLNKNLEEQNDKKPTKVSPDAKTATASPGSASPEYGWAVNGLPLSHGSVVGEPMGRNQWDSSLFACLGRNDEFCSSDLEVCKSLILFVMLVF